MHHLLKMTYEMVCLTNNWQAYFNLQQVVKNLKSGY
jgi:hypothetical protein